MSEFIVAFVGFFYSLEAEPNYMVYSKAPDGTYLPAETEKYGVINNPCTAEQAFEKMAAISTELMRNRNG